jgi:FKBP-type peptidyl-prolyl cis-trans isomerase SlyD
MSEEKIHFLKKSHYARIAKDKVVRLKYLISDPDTAETLEFRDDLYYLHGGYGGAFPVIEQALQDHGVGDKIEIMTSCEEAFGPVRDYLKMQVPLHELPKEAHQTGAVIEGESEQGERVSFRVIGVDQGMAQLDGNHPFAGRDLRFMLEVLDIRPATDKELEAGYAFRS